MTFSKSTIIKILINTLIGLALIFIWMRFVDIGQIINTISKIRPIYLLLVSAFIFLSLVIRALRLRVFLAPYKKVLFKDLVFLNGVALMLNFLIPIRAGDIAKGVYLGSRYDLPVGRSLVWIFLDRFIDFIVTLVLGSLLLTVVANQLPQNFTLILVTVSLALLSVVYLMVFQVRLAGLVFGFFKNFLILNSLKRYFTNIYDFFLDSFQILKRTPQDLFLLFFITVLAYASDAFVWYFTFYAIGQIQDYFRLYLAQLLSSLIYLIPAAPGYVGSAEASGLLVFTGVFGIDANLASSMTVLFHITLAVFVLVFGIISVYFLKFDVSGVLKKVFRKA